MSENTKDEVSTESGTPEKDTEVIVEKVREIEAEKKRELKSAVFRLSRIRLFARTGRNAVSPRVRV